MILHDKFDIYKANKDYVNPSAFKKEEINTPAKFEYEFHNGIKKESGEMSLGTALHCLILTPELFEKENYLCKKDTFSGKLNKDGSPSMADKDNKKVYEVLKQDNPGKDILFFGEVEKVYGMQAGLKRFLTPEYYYILDLKNSTCETSIYFAAEFDEKFNFIRFLPENPDFKGIYYCNDGKHYLRVKTRSDHFHMRKNYASDLKTCNSIDYDDFSKDAYTYGYHIQAAFTLDLLNAHLIYPKELGENVRLASRGENCYNVFYFIAVENTPPYQSIIFEAAQPFIHKGREVYQNRLSHICQGFASQKWQGYEIYADSITFDDDGNILNNYKTMLLDLPQWAYIKYEKKIKHEHIKAF